jgi:O-antigen/teichoic acid export membrane protein
VTSWFSPRVVSWAGKGFWAVVDQALFAGTNFLVNILLARWLEPAAYGAFATAYAVFLLLGTLHTALWTEPMLVYGSSRYREAFGAYQAVLLRYHWRFALVVFAVFGILGLGLGVVGQRELALSFLGLSLAAPVVLYMWLVRRGAYVLLDPRLAALGGGVYLLLYLALATFLMKVGSLNNLTALLAMALGALMAAEAIRLRLVVGLQGGVDPSAIWQTHWSYGRWVVLAGIFSWVPGSVPLFALSLKHDLEATAQFKVLQDLLMPVFHVLAALNQLLVPLMARVSSKSERMRNLRVFLAIFLLLSMAYWALLATQGLRIIIWLYGEKYAHLAPWLPLMGFLPVIGAVVFVMGGFFRALGLPKVVTFAYGVGALFSLFIGSVMVWVGGIEGGVFSSLLVQLLMAMVFALYYKREVQ